MHGLHSNCPSVCLSVCLSLGLSVRPKRRYCNPSTSTPWVNNAALGYRTSDAVYMEDDVSVIDCWCAMAQSVSVLMCTLYVRTVQSSRLACCY